MAAVAKPMEKVDKITIIDNGGKDGASKLTKVVTDVTTGEFQAVKDLTGLDIPDIISAFVNKETVVKDEDEAEEIVVLADN